MKFWPKASVLRYLLLLLIVFSISYVFGVLIILRFTSNETQESVKEYLYFKSFIEDSLKVADGSEEEKAAQIFGELIKRVKPPGNAEQVTKKKPIEILLSQSGSCDQQSLLFNHLLNCENIKADVIHLKGCDSVSHHTISCVYLNNKPTFWDPFCGYVFKDVNGRYYSFSEISDVLSQFSSCGEVDYTCVFSNHIPYDVAASNAFTGKMKFYKWWIDLYFKFPGGSFLQKIVS